jgi:hypothetical protein
MRKRVWYGRQREEGVARLWFKERKKKREKEKGCPVLYTGQT